MKSSRIFKYTVMLVTLSFSTTLFAQQQTQAATTNQAQPKTQSVKAELSEDELNGKGNWRVVDFEPYIQAIKDLKKLNKDYSETLLKKAMDEYSTGLDILEDMEADVQKLRIENKNKKNLNERYYWQEIDRRNRQKRKIGYIKRDAKVKSITYFTKAINLLDSVQNMDVRKKPEFVNFQIKLYQVYVSTQYDLQNFKPCLPILERYITINEKTAKDVWAYKYLASCYGFMEKNLEKYRSANPDEILEYKQKKNIALLQSAEFKYGIDSHQYKYLKEIVEKDEKKSERINDYK